jgi:hypothetical protein
MDVGSSTLVELPMHASQRTRILGAMDPRYSQKVVRCNRMCITRNPYKGRGDTLCCNRKSCAMTVPMIASAMEVRTHPKNVLSLAR